MLVMQIRLVAGGIVEVPVPAAWNALAYVISGRVQSSDVVLRERQMAVFGDGASVIELNTAADTEVLVLAGEPIDEPVVSWGPFVMNTTEQIIQARKDYASGRMGTLAGR
jgi:redox-sensitive bicupin YhaK (pirin superfamily)